MSIQVKNKITIVTGAAMGIGLACAQTLAAAGSRVMLTDIADEAGEAAAKTIRDEGGTADFRHLDITSESEWTDVVSDTIDIFGGFNVLVNNAGIFDVRFLLDTTLEQWRKVQTTNVDGTFLGVRESVRAMQPGGKAGQGGSIVNISSCAGLKGSPGHSAYCASKAAVHLLTTAVAAECAALGMGIRVNSVHPAVIETPMSENAMKLWANIFTQGNKEVMTEQIKNQHLLGRMGTPEEVANAVLYLASDASSFSTGIELKVDGGYAI